MDILLKIIAVPAGVFLVLTTYAYINQNNMVYFPDNREFQNCPGFSDSEKIEHDGTRIYYGGGTDPLVVFYHGNAGSACDRSFIKNVLKGAGVSWAFVEYAGYSGDARKPTRNRILEDARNAQSFIEESDHKKVVVMGSSLGAAVSAYHSTLTEPDKIVLLASFDKLSNLGKKHYPYLPVKTLLKEEYETDKWIKGFKGELLMLHGTADSIVPIEFGRKVFESATTKEKKFVEIQGAGHNDMWAHAETEEAIINFINN